MAVGNNKQRITITVSNEMAEKLDYYSGKMGVNRSAMCAQFVGQAIMGFDKAFEMGAKYLADSLEKSGLDGDFQLKGQISIDDVISLDKKG
jgi:hypothetical protein